MIVIDKNFLKLSFIGILTGAIASVIGGGAEVLIVPLLIFFNVFNEYKIAVGTSLASLLLPIGIVAVYFYSNSRCNGASCINWMYAFTLSFFFIIGTFASYFTTNIESKPFKILFSTFLIILGCIMLFSQISQNN